MPSKYTDQEAEFLRHVGSILREHRRACGLTQEKAAEMAGLTVTYLRDVERGKRNVGMLNLARLAKALGLELGDLLREPEL